MQHGTFEWNLEWFRSQVQQESVYDIAQRVCAFTHCVSPPRRWQTKYWYGELVKTLVTVLDIYSRGKVPAIDEILSSFTIHQKDLRPSTIEMDPPDAEYVTVEIPGTEIPTFDWQL